MKWALLSLFLISSTAISQTIDPFKVKPYSCLYVLSKSKDNVLDKSHKDILRRCQQALLGKYLEKQYPDKMEGNKCQDFPKLKEGEKRDKKHLLQADALPFDFVLMMLGGDSKGLKDSIKITLDNENNRIDVKIIGLPCSDRLDPVFYLVRDKKGYYLDLRLEFLDKKKGIYDYLTCATATAIELNKVNYSAENVLDATLDAPELTTRKLGRQQVYMGAQGNINFLFGQIGNSECDEAKPIPGVNLSFGELDTAAAKSCFADYLKISSVDRLSKYGEMMKYLKEDMSYLERDSQKKLVKRGDIKKMNSTVTYYIDKVLTPLLESPVEVLYLKKMHPDEELGEEGDKKVFKELAYASVFTLYTKLGAKGNRDRISTELQTRRGVIEQVLNWVDSPLTKGSLKTIMENMRKNGHNPSVAQELYGRVHEAWTFLQYSMLDSGDIAKDTNEAKKWMRVSYDINRKELNKAWVKGENLRDVSSFITVQELKEKMNEKSDDKDDETADVDDDDVDKDEEKKETMTVAQQQALLQARIQRQQQLYAAIGQNVGNLTQFNNRNQSLLNKGYRPAQANDFQRMQSLNGSNPFASPYGGAAGFSLARYGARGRFPANASRLGLAQNPYMMPIGLSGLPQGVSPNAYLRGINPYQWSNNFPRSPYYQMPPNTWTRSLDTWRRGPVIRPQDMYRLAI